MESDVITCYTCPHDVGKMMADGKVEMIQESFVVGQLTIG